MTCTEIQESLALFVYEELSPEAHSQVQTHLDECTKCLHDCQEIRSLKRDLSLVPVPETQVEISQIVSQMQAKQERSMRLWRRVAIGVGVLAASLLIMMVLRIEIHVDGNHLILSWGKVSETEHIDPIQMHQEVNPKQLTELEDRIHVLNQLLLALSNDWDTNEKQRKADLAWTNAQMDALQLQTQQRWLEMKGDFSALYNAQFSRGEGGN